MADQSTNYTQKNQNENENEKEKDDPFSESTHDMVAAAHKLMKLSDELYTNNDNDVDVRGIKRKRISSPGGEERAKKMNESTDIRPKKRPKKYRSLADIYRVTKPIITSTESEEEEEGGGGGGGGRKASA